MSRGLRKNHYDWTQERIADALKAAADGRDWGQLASLWDCSSENALQWCKRYVPLDVCQKIGQNGTLRRYKNNGRKYVAEQRSKPPMQPARQSNGKVYFLRCNHILSRGERQGQSCGAPTERGKHACPDCLAKERTIKNLALRDSIKTYI